MENIRSGGQRYRLWITAYTDWHPVHWSDSPPLATALEAVDESLYTADEASLFVQGFNLAMLEKNDPIWAVAVAVTVRYEGDAQEGMPVRGHAFGPDRSTPAADEFSSPPHVADSDPPPIGLSSEPYERDQVQGFGQSPQRSR
jgi:hypothetical protein